MAEQTVNKCQLWLCCWLSLQGVGIRTNLLTVVSMIFPVAPVFITEWRQGGRTRGSFQACRCQLCGGDEEKKELCGSGLLRQDEWIYQVESGRKERERKRLSRDKQCVQESGRVSPPSRTPEEVWVWVESTVQWGWFFFFITKAMRLNVYFLPSSFSRSMEIIYRRPLRVIKLTIPLPVKWEKPALSKFWIPPWMLQKQN